MDSLDTEPLNPGGALIPFFGRYENTHRVRYEFASQLAQNGRCVDVGCGYGFGTHLLATATQGQVVGIDVDGDCIAYARSHFRRNNLSFTLADSTAIPAADSSLSLITCFEVVEHLRPRQLARLLKETHRTISDDGVIIGSTPNGMRSHGDLVFHVHEFEPSELSTVLVNAGFDLEMFTQGRNRGTGSSSFNRAVELLPAGLKRTRALKIAQSLLFATWSPPGSPDERVVPVTPSNPEFGTNIIFMLRRSRC
jgi:SAM-dependent methyltransferase